MDKYQFDIVLLMSSVRLGSDKYQFDIILLMPSVRLGSDKYQFDIILAATYLLRCYIAILSRVCYELKFKFLFI